MLVRKLHIGTFNVNCRYNITLINTQFLVLIWNVNTIYIIVESNYFDEIVPRLYRKYHNSIASKFG